MNLSQWARCTQCNSFGKAPNIQSGYCKTFSFVDNCWIGNIENRAVHERCPYDKVIP